MYTPAHCEHTCFTPDGQKLFLSSVLFGINTVLGLFHFWCVPKNISKESNLRKANPGTTDVSSHNFWFFLKYDNSGKKFVKSTLFSAKVVDWTSVWWILWDTDLNGVWITEPSSHYCHGWNWRCWEISLIWSPIQQSSNVCPMALLGLPSPLTKMMMVTSPLPCFLGRLGTPAAAGEAQE